MRDATQIPPLFRWAGGKQRIVKHLLHQVPPDLSRRLYIEPFLGAGSLFFRLLPKKAMLSDANADLVACYDAVRQNPALVARYLASHAKWDSKSYYYEVRDDFNDSRWSAANAARFIYLNRTSFNGIYRVNEAGRYNVPYGHLAYPAMPDSMRLRQIGSALDRAQLQNSCFRDALRNVPKRSFVYLDPPYPPLNGTSFFQHYTFDRFSEDDQDDLAHIVLDLDDRGVLFLMTNADTPLIRRLYRSFHISPLSVPRWVSCKGTKNRVCELIIRNY